MQDLTVTLIQTNLQWRDPQANREHLESEILAIPRATDLILLPEMFTSAFITDPRQGAEAHPGETLDWMLKLAAETGAAITGSIAAEVDGRYFNRLLFVTPEQKVYHYDKRHLFRMMGEHERYNAGQAKLLVEWRGWRILPLVCYDLRFPVWCRNTAGDTYDLCLFVANWPSARHHHWRTLLQARAIENLAYVAGVNRIGQDGRGIDYQGHSAVVNFLGQEIAQAGDAVGNFSSTLQMDKLGEYRAQFPAHLDADNFNIF
jgi:omega-amidase